jgi:uncharacterized membrane protein
MTLAVKHVYKKQLDVLFSLFVTGLAALLLTFLPAQSGAWRTALVLPVSLFVPGYLFTLLLFPKQHLSADQRFALSIGLSIFSVVLVGLALNYTPWGIRTGPTILALFALVSVLGVLVWLRRLALPDDSLFHPAVSGRVLLLGLGLLVGVVFVADLITPTQHTTEFYMLGSEGRLDSYPRRLQAGETFPLTLGVINHGRRQQGYKVESRVTAEDKSSGTVSAQVRTVVADVPALAQRKPWESEVVFSAPATPGDYTLELYLYRNQDKTPYRSLSLFLSVSPSALDASASLTLGKEDYELTPR